MYKMLRTESSILVLLFVVVLLCFLKMLRNTFSNIIFNLKFLASFLFSYLIHLAFIFMHFSRCLTLTYL